MRNGSIKVNLISRQPKPVVKRAYAQINPYAHETKARLLLGGFIVIGTYLASLKIL